MAESKTVTPAYVPFKTFTSALDAFTGFLPDRIDSTMWPNYSGGIKSQLLGALRFLLLVDDENRPTEALRILAKTDAQSRPGAFRTVMKAAYQTLMSLDLTRATPGSFDAEMRKYGQEGDTHRKAASFFLQAAKWCGVPLSPLLMKKGGLASTRRKRTVGTPKPREKVSTPFKITIPNENLTPPIGSEREIVLSDGSRLILRTDNDVFRMTSNDRRFVMGLLDTLEKYESEHPQDESLDEEDEDAE